MVSTLGPISQPHATDRAPLLQFTFLDECFLAYNQLPIYNEWAISLEKLWEGGWEGIWNSLDRSTESVT